MASNKPRFSKQTFPDYLKLGLALNITKDCLQSLVETEAQEFQQSVLQEIQGKPPCTECKIENILECPTAGLCKAKRCPFHTSSLKQPRQCPNGVCNIFRDRIRDAFRQYKSSHAQPSWRNTDVRRWCLDPFQLMKCFLPTGEYDEVKSTRELDLYGLLSVIMNCKRFDERLSDDLSKKENICSKVVKIERIYRKCESLTLTEMEVFTYVDVLITLLSDPKIPFQHKAENAAEKLKQLRVDNLQTSTQEVTAILDEALHDSMEKKSNRIAYEQQQQDTAVELRIKLLTCCREIFSRENRKIKTGQLESLVSEERPAINELKEIAKKKQEAQERKLIEKVIAVPLRKSAEFTNGTSFSLPCRTEVYDKLKTAGQVLAVPTNRRIKDEGDSVEQELIRNHHSTAADRQEYDGISNESDDSSAIESIETVEDTEDEDDRQITEDAIYDITVSDVIRDVLLTLRDRPDIVMELIKSEKEKLSKQIDAFNDLVDGDSAGDSLAGYMKPAVQLKSEPKSVVKKSGHFGIAEEQDSGETQIADKRADEVINDEYTRDTETDESEEYRDFLQKPQEGGRNDSMFDYEKPKTKSSEDIDSEETSFSESKREEDTRELAQNPNEDHNVVRLPYRFPFLHPMSFWKGYGQNLNSQPNSLQHSEDTIKDTEADEPHDNSSLDEEENESSDVNDNRELINSEEELSNLLLSGHSLHSD